MTTGTGQDNHAAAMAGRDPGLKARSAVLLGASGLVGKHCLAALVANPLYAEIKVVTRRPLGLVDATPKVHEVIVDFDRLAAYRNELTGPDAFCAFGTTIAKAGSRESFRRVDYDYPKQFASLLRSNGAQRFILVSSKGALATSKNFYLRTKGALEDALQQMHWPALTILRPSIIGGRRAETRLVERIGQVLLSVAPASIRTVPAESIAAAMVDIAFSQSPPAVRIVESSEIHSYGPKA